MDSFVRGNEVRQKEFRVAVLVSHPTQFEAGLFRKISQKSPLRIKVFFWRTDRLAHLFDPELGRVSGWDIPLTEGYDHSLLPEDFRSRWKFLKTEIFERGAYDGILVNGYSGWVPLLAFLMGFAFRAPLILRSDTTLLYPRPLWKRGIRSIILRIFFLRIPAFMVTGTLARQHLLHYGVPPEKIFWFPYSVDTEHFVNQCLPFRNQRKELRSGLGIDPNSKIILGVLKFIPREGVFDLLKAHALLAGTHPELTLMLVGDGEQRESLENFVRERQVPRVVFSGYLPYSHLPKYYAVADVFVHPGIREPWGVSVNEAMACGLPVIVSDLVGSAADLVREGENGHVYRGGDVGDLCRVLKKFLEHPDPQERMGNQSLKIIREWDYERNIDGLKRVLATLAPLKAGLQDG